MSRLDQDRRNEYNRALHVLMAKLRCRGHALSCFLDEQPSRPDRPVPLAVGPQAFRSAWGRGQPDLGSMTPSSIEGAASPTIGTGFPTDIRVLRSSSISSRRTSSETRF